MKTTGAVWPDGTAYMFRGADCLRVVPGTVDVEAGYPKPTSEEFPGLPDRGPDAVAVWPNGNFYFFSGSEYWRGDVTSRAVDAGYPQRIGDSWPGLTEAGFDSGLDAIAVWPGGKAYFFKGSHYLRYDTEADAVDPGYPLKISDSWPGVSDNLDAFIVVDPKAYAVRGGEYVRYDIADDRADSGFPQSSAGTWLALFDSADDSGAGASRSGDSFSFEPTSGESERDRVVRCCHQALDDGPLGQFDRHDLYREFISCGQEKSEEDAERLTKVTTSCAMFVRAVLRWSGLPPTGPYPRHGQGMFKSMGNVSLGHKSFVRYVKSNAPRPGDYFFIANKPDGVDGHTGIFIEDLGDGQWRTAEGGGGGKQDGTLCRFETRQLGGSVFPNDPNRRQIVGWFDCTMVGLSA